MLERESSLRPAGSAIFPPALSHVPERTLDALDRAVTLLQGRKNAWLSVGLHERILMLDAIRHNLGHLGRRKVTASMRSKGDSPGSFGEAEEWWDLGLMIRSTVKLRQSLTELQHNRQIQLTRLPFTRENGQVVVQTFPSNLHERLLFSGMTGEVWLDSGVGVKKAFQLPPAVIEPGQQGSVVLVLAAGNTGIAGFQDVLSKLFTENLVVMLKMNPVNDYLCPLFEEALSPLIQGGYLQIATGGKEVGEYLSNHPGIESIHLTGSDKTYEAIVFGPGLEGADRKAAGLPVMAKPVTAGLGGVNPLIVVPGPWTSRQIRQQALHLATHLYTNAGYMCQPPRVIIQQAGWNKREAFIKEIGKALARAGSRTAYYPGTMERYTAIQAGHSKTLKFGQEGPNRLPWTFLVDVNSKDETHPAFRSESFCSLYAETALEAGSPAEFIRNAVDFANRVLWGNLTATILIHPTTARNRLAAAALEEAIEQLEYGLITINAAPTYATSLMMPPFGAYPGNPAHDIQSGVGKVTNFQFLNQPQKAVFRAPFNFYDPYHLGRRGITDLARMFTRYWGDPSPRNLIRLMWKAS